MNYNNIYWQLINKANSRKLLGYTEKHHVVPRCLGGKDTSENLVDLTPEEHFIAHKLLVKMYPNNQKLVYAAIAMVRNRPTNKLYGWLRRKYSLVCSERQSGERNVQFGTKWISNCELQISKRIMKDRDIPDGWVLGRNVWKSLIRICKNTKCKKEFLRNERKGHFCSDQCKKECTQYTTCNKKYKNGYIVEVDGKQFDSISQAADFYKIGHETARMRFKSKNYNNWKIISGV